MNKRSYLGDLVNGANDLFFKGDRIFQAGQYEEEWRIYRNILDRTNITRYTHWLDLRGNHGRGSSFFSRFFSDRFDDLI